MKPINLLYLAMLDGCNQQDHIASTDSILLAPPDSIPTTYVGAQQCASCHQTQYTSWQGSHHDLAMQLVDDDTVLGNFDDAAFDYFGTVSRFFKKDEQFLVQTDGPDGELTDYPIAYVFGVYPLQQYLVRFPKGHFQVLSIAWDSRGKEQGGQRWFHLYPDENIEHGDELHWTGINHNWNYMCADCHSTNLQKNYKLASKAYQTNWSEIDVGCEACHGPASQHVAWASTDNRSGSSKGFSVTFAERQSVIWPIDPVSGNAKRSLPKETNTENEACAQCHARRSTNYADARPEHALLDNFRLSLLTEGLYHADGQIDGEVYVYGSFVQSKMYHADEGAAWAAKLLEQRFGKPSRKHFAEAIHAGREGRRDAAPLLAALIADDKQPAIARATAVSLMSRYLSRETAPLLQIAANDEEPLLGLGLANAMESMPPLSAFTRTQPHWHLFIRPHTSTWRTIIALQVMTWRVRKCYKKHCWPCGTKRRSNMPWVCCTPGEKTCRMRSIIWVGPQIVLARQLVTGMFMPLH